MQVTTIKNCVQEFKERLVYQVGSGNCIASFEMYE